MPKNSQKSLKILSPERALEKKTQFTLHLSHKEGNSSSEVKFFCNFLYIALMDLSTYIKEATTLLPKHV